MLNTFGSIRGYLKLSVPSIYIDNNVFKLHYRITTLILLGATVLVTSRQYFGEHIRCISDQGVPPHVIDTFCFFTATYTVVKYLNSSWVDLEAVAHPGVGTIGPLGMDSKEPVIQHTYYQWVPFVLFLQAIMFYIPHLIWKHFEGSRMSRLVEGFKYAAFAVTDRSFSVDGKTIPSKEMREQQMQTVFKNFMKRLYVNRSWSMWLTVCETMNLFNIILQIFLTNEFLGGQFLTMGDHLINKGVESSVDILDIVFPKVTKCTFHKYGPSGSIQSHDAMCVMALNIINDKIYSFLWFWFLILLAASILGIGWRIITYCLHARSRRFNGIVFGMSCPGRLNPWDVITVTKHCSYTDWLFLYYVSKNMDGIVFRELLIGLAQELDKKNTIMQKMSEKEPMMKTE